MPGERQNSRVKDLPDIVLLVGVREIGGVHLRTHSSRPSRRARCSRSRALYQNRHPTGHLRYARMVDEDELRWLDLAELTRAIRTFLNPVLGGAPRTWSPETWTWSE